MNYVSIKLFKKIRDVCNLFRNALKNKTEEGWVDGKIHDKTIQ